MQWASWKSNKRGHYEKKKLDQIANPIRWYEGMPIGPQHLQDAFYRSEDLIRYRLSLASPYPYGIINLKIDEELLKANIFKVLELECILPDGLEIAYMPALDKALEINLSQLQDKIKDHQFIHLCVPYQKIIGTQEMKHSRYCALPSEMVPDLNANGESIGITRYRPNLCLKMNAQTIAEYISIPIAQISLDNRTMGLVPYVPPTLITKKGNLLLKICESLLVLIKSKITTLTHQYKIALCPTEHIIKLIHVLRGVVPQMELALHNPQISPYELYTVLVQVYSSVLFFDSSLEENALPRYDHENLLTVFSECRDIITSYLEVEAPNDYSMSYFEQKSNHFSVSILEPLTHTGELLLGFRKPDLLKEPEFINFIENILICEKENFSTLQESRSIGFTRKKVKMDDLLFLNKNLYLYSIKTSEIKNSTSPEIIVYSNLLTFNTLEKKSVILYKKIGNNNEKK